MIQAHQAFSQTYAQARVKFLEAAATQSLAIESFQHPLKGVEDEDLAMDIALDGVAKAKKMLVVSSACHGVEGYCGSGVQVFALHDDEWLAKARDAGVSVLYIHALNPHGFSHTRRVTNENVDLNRNFQDFSKPLPENKAYAEWHDLMLPAAWPPDAANLAATQTAIAAQGMQALQNAVSSGQYTHPDGLFFGGTAPTWSNQTVRQVVRKYCQGAEQLAWIDLHTGLGPEGYGERIFAGRPSAENIARARKWWGNTGVTHPDGRLMDGKNNSAITSTYDGSSTSALLTGMMSAAIIDEAGAKEYTAIALEYGTQPMMQVMTALRGDHWLYKHEAAGGKAPEALKAAIKKTIRDAFYVDTDAWKAQIVVQARQAMFQAVQGLKFPPLMDASSPQT